jgi:hypothetical protein
METSDEQSAMTPGERVITGASYIAHPGAFVNTQ